MFLESFLISGDGPQAALHSPEPDSSVKNPIRRRVREHDEVTLSSKFRRMLQVLPCFLAIVDQRPWIHLAAVPFSTFQADYANRPDRKRRVVHIVDTLPLN